MAARLQIDNKPSLQLVLIMCLFVGLLLLSSVIAIGVALVFYGIDINTLQYMMNDLPNAGEKAISVAKLTQLITAAAIFIIAPVVYSFLVFEKPFKSFQLNTSGKKINYLLIVLLMFASMPLVSWIIELNANMVLPDFMSSIEQWMRTKELQNGQATKAFLTFDGVGSLIYMLIVIAVIPAVGEELLFRGVLQKIFINWFKKPHLAIWVTAILFSALHMQFFGFFPRMLLGVLFGYIFYWSKSLWLPILGHFINNGSVVILSYFYPEMIKNADVSIFEENEYSVVFYIASFILSMGIIFLIKKVNEDKAPQTS
jgi:membrane protease YdiL (CAAX protease family)